MINRLLQVKEKGQSYQIAKQVSILAICWAGNCLWLWWISGPCFLWLEKDVSIYWKLRLFKKMAEDYANCSCSVIRSNEMQLINGFWCHIVSKHSTWCVVYQLLKLSLLPLPSLKYPQRGLLGFKKMEEEICVMTHRSWTWACKVHGKKTCYIRQPADNRRPGTPKPRFIVRLCSWGPIGRVRIIESYRWKGPQEVI